MRFSFEKKLNLFFTGICSAIIVVGIITYSKNKSAIIADNWVKHTSTVINVLENLLLSNIDIVTDTKEFLVHYNFTILAPLESSKSLAISEFADLKRLTADNPIQQLRIDSLGLLQDRQIKFSERNIQQRKGNDFVTGVEMSAVFQEMNQIDDIRNLIERIQLTENKLLKERKEVYLNNFNAFNTSIYIFYSSIFLLLIIVFWIIRYNIKKRKEISDSLQESLTAVSLYKNELENQSKAISRSNSIAEFDLDGTILSANTNFLNLFGYALEEIKGKNHSIFLTQEQIRSNGSPEFWKQLNDGNFHRGEFERKNKAGETIWIQGSFNPIFNSAGKLVKVLQVVTDITEQVTSVKEIYDYKTELEQQEIKTSRSNAIAEFNAEGNITKANQNFLTLFGYTLEEIKGKHHTILLTEEQAGSASHIDFQKQIEAFKFKISEFERKKKEGESIWVQGTYNPIYDAEGKLVKVIKIIY